METYPIQHQIALHSLRLRWMLLTVFSLVFLYGTYDWLAGSWQPAGAERWLVLSLGIILLLLWTLWRNLPANHRHGERQLLPTLGAGNTLTYLRGLSVATTAGFVLSPPRSDGWAFLPAAFYTLATLGDFLDGYLARRQDHATRLGEILDMYVDGIGVLAATLLLIQYGKVPVWYLLVGLARYLFLAGLQLRQRMGKLVYPLPNSDARRALAAVQMNFIVILLWPLFSPPATIIAATAFAIPFLANFLHDWLIVSGAITPQLALPTWIQRICLHCLNFGPLFLRSAIFALTISPALTRLLDSPPQTDLYALLGFPAQEITLVIPILLNLVVPVMLLFGFAGRAASLAGLVSIGISQNFISLTSAQMLLVILFAAVLHLGTGSLSLWKPEDRLISLRAGQRDSRSVPPEPAPASQVHLGNTGSSLREAS